MDLESAEPATSRRHLFGALGAAGLASAAALAISRPASAAPFSPTPSDKELLNQAMQFELTARDLYLAAVDGGLSEEAATLAREFAANHAAYADGIAGASGFSADTRNDELFREHEADFSGGDDMAFAEAGIALENTTAATHTELFGEYESNQARTLAASIVMVEARMATVLAEFAGQGDDLDALLEPEAEPLTLSGSTS